MVSGPVFKKIRGKGCIFILAMVETCFATKSVRFDCTELSFFFWRNLRREIYNLGMVSGPVLQKIKGISWIFMFLGVNKTETNLKIWTKSVKCWSLEP